MSERRQSRILCKDRRLADPIDYVPTDQSGLTATSTRTVIITSAKQTDAAKQAQIVASVDHPFEAPTKGFETLLLNETAEPALRRFAAQLVADGEWPPHLAAETPQAGTPVADLRDALRKYLGWSKGSGGAADLLGTCIVAEMPATVKTVLAAIKVIAQPAAAPPPGVAAP